MTCSRSGSFRLATMNKRWGRLTAWLGIIAIVFAQLAVAAYACPLEIAVGSGASGASSVAAPSPCDKVDMQQANLCEKHCHDSQQSQAAAPAMHAGFIPGYIVVVHLSSWLGSAGAMNDAVLLHATSPPATIRNCCFRI